MDFSGWEWCMVNHSGHLATHSRSFTISTMNAHGWNEWIRTRFSSSELEHSKII
jgi:hypothetical protein